jgi:hypothetical protein
MNVARSDHCRALHNDIAAIHDEIEPRHRPGEYIRDENLNPVSLVLYGEIPRPLDQRIDDRVYQTSVEVDQQK